MQCFRHFRTCNGFVMSSLMYPYDKPLRIHDTRPPGNVQLSTVFHPRFRISNLVPSPVHGRLSSGEAVEGTDKIISCAVTVRLCACDQGAAVDPSNVDVPAVGPAK